MSKYNISNYVADPNRMDWRGIYNGDSEQDALNQRIDFCLRANDRAEVFRQVDIWGTFIVIHDNPCWNGRIFKVQPTSTYEIVEINR